MNASFPTDHAHRSRHGFTLIELLTVIVIVGVLAGIALPRLWAARMEAFQAVATSDLRNVVLSQELRWAPDTGYAASLEALGVDVSDGVEVTFTAASRSGWAAVATHGSFPTVQCGVFMGSASASDAPPAQVRGAVRCSR